MERDCGRANLARQLTALRLGQELLATLLSEPRMHEDGRPATVGLIDAMERAVDKIARTLGARF